MVNQSKITFNTTENRPRVTTLTGKKTSFKIGLTKENKIVSTKLAIAKVSQLAKEIVGKNQARMNKMMAVRSKGLSITSSIAQTWRRRSHLDGILKKNAHYSVIALSFLLENCFFEKR